MPSIHIPEHTWTQLLMQHNGDRDAALSDVKDAVKGRVRENREDNDDE